MTSKASPISLGNSAEGISEESREAVVGGACAVLGMGVLWCAGCWVALRSVLPPRPPPPPEPAPPCTFFSISFSMDSR